MCSFLKLSCVYCVLYKNKKDEGNAEVSVENNGLIWLEYLMKEKFDQATIMRDFLNPVRFSFNVLLFSIF